MFGVKFRGCRVSRGLRFRVVGLRLFRRGEGVGGYGLRALYLNVLSFEVEFTLLQTAGDFRIPLVSTCYGFIQTAHVTTSRKFRAQAPADS